MLLMLTASSLRAAELDTVEIRLASDTKNAFTARQGKQVEMSPKHATEFVITPGLANPGLVSLQLKSNKKFYIRHEGFVLFLHEFQKGKPLYDADASFKLLNTADGKLRFEASNYPGRFITVNASGTISVVANSPLEQSTFILKK